MFTQIASINFLLLALEQELFCVDSECNAVLAPAGVQRMKRKMERFTEMKVGLPSRYFYQELKRGFDNSGSMPQIIPHLTLFKHICIEWAL